MKDGLFREDIRKIYNHLDSLSGLNLHRSVYDNHLNPIIRHLRNIEQDVNFVMKELNHILETIQKK